MVKRKKSPSSSKHDVKTTAIIVLLFVAVVLLFLLFSKEKQKPQERPLPFSHVEQPVSETVKPKKIKSLFVQKAAPGLAGKIAIILDDWGYNTHNCQYLKEIHQPLAVAILPGLRHSDDIAKCAALYNKLVMLHLPLDGHENNNVYPPDYVITTAMKPAKVVKIIEGTLAKMPLVEGVNNHMGSKATADAGLMKIILKELKKKGLFFVDSMTTPHSVCVKLAGECGVPVARRDIFLDNSNTRADIIKQIIILAKKAREKGYAVAIGHDRTLTLQVIKEQIPLLEAQGFDIVSIKQLLKKK